MALGVVSLKLTLSDQEFKTSMNRAVNQVKSSVNLMKNVLVAAQLGRYLFSGAAQQAREELKQVQTAMSAMSEGFSKEMIQNLQPIIDKVDYLGVSADQAADSLYKFVLTGRTMSLQQLGIYLDKDTQSMLAAANAAERYEWALKNIPDKLDDIMNSLSPTTKAYYEFQKKADDVKKALGTSFTAVIVKIIDAFGGLTNTMKMAIIAFTAYKTAMILGNVGIGIAKAIAMGSVFSAPIAIAMGVAALGSIAALIGGASLAVNALNNVPEFDSSTAINSNNTSGNNTTNNSQPQTIVVVRDKYGELQETIDNSSNTSSSIQTNYGR